jgi:polysaccharide pyruvyl transferase WcaK-like protein
MSPSSRPLRARYIGYTKGTENHGDEALMWIIASLLAPEIEVVFGEGDCDLALLGGGTLINQSPWLIDYFGDALRKCGRGFVFGTGVGDPTFWGNHFSRWNGLLDQCDFVGVRGPDSLKLLQDGGFSRARFIGDPYLVLEPPLRLKPMTRTLGVNFGTTNDSQWGGDEREFFAFVTSVLRHLKENGWRLLWVSVWEKDLPILRGLRDSLGDGGDLLDARMQCAEVLTRLSGCELFLGEKLHANAMAAVAGVPFIALEYQPKVRDFAASVAMEEWVLSTAERRVDEVVRKLEQMAEVHETLRERMGTEVSRRRRDIKDFAAEIRTHFSLPGKR